MSYSYLFLIIELQTVLRLSLNGLKQPQLVGDERSVTSLPALSPVRLYTVQNTRTAASCSLIGSFHRVRVLCQTSAARP